MRNFVILATATALAACGGAGPQTAGSVSPPASTGTSTPTPTASFVNPTETKTYEGIGGVQHFEYTTRNDRIGQSAQLYAGDANTVRDSGITVTYNPRDAIFDITVQRDKGSVSVSANRFQDPVHRTAFGGQREPQAGTPPTASASQIQYLQSGSSTGDSVAVTDSYRRGEDKYSSQTQTFFYQKPGTTTQYVTYAGYLRTTLGTSKQTATDAAGNTTSYLQNSYSIDRAAFAYGERTANSAVPNTGSGTYTGDMLATMVYNTALDTDSAAATFFQWITGTNTTTINFADLSVKQTLSGTVGAPTLDAYSMPTDGSGTKTWVPTGSTFSATAAATIDLVNKGGFTGKFSDAGFKTPTGNDLVVTIAGSSLDGAFFGPKGEEVGGGFRIVGGNPDERVDILGTFTGKK